MRSSEPRQAWAEEEPEPLGEVHGRAHLVVEVAGERVEVDGRLDDAALQVVAHLLRDVGAHALLRLLRRGAEVRQARAPSGAWRGASPWAAPGRARRGPPPATRPPSSAARSASSSISSPRAALTIRTPGLDLRERVLAEEVLRLLGERRVEGEVVGGLRAARRGVRSLTCGLLGHRRRDERVEGLHLHPEGAAARRDLAADAAEADDPEPLAEQLDARRRTCGPTSRSSSRRRPGRGCAARASIRATASSAVETRVAARRVHHEDAAAGRGGEVDVVDARRRPRPMTLRLFAASITSAFIWLPLRIEDGVVGRHDLHELGRGQGLLHVDASSLRRARISAPRSVMPSRTRMRWLTGDSSWRRSDAKAGRRLSLFASAELPPRGSSSRSIARLRQASQAFHTICGKPCGNSPGGPTAQVPWNEGLVQFALRDSSVTGACDLRDGRLARAAGVIPVTGAILPLRVLHSRRRDDDAHEHGGPGDPDPGGGGAPRRRRSRPRRAGRSAARRGPRSACSRTPTTSRRSIARASRRSAPGPGLPDDPAYRIAGFYRSHEGGYPRGRYGWSAFWTNGYRAPRPAPLPPATAARSARTATSSWPCRSSRPSARSAAPSSGTERPRPASDARPAGLAPEAVGEALEAAHRLVALDPLDAVHRVEERDEAEPVSRRRASWRIQSSNAARSMPRTATPAGCSDRSTPKTFSRGECR